MSTLPGGLRARAHDWIGDLIPSPGDGRRLAVLTFVQALGMGVFLSSGALFLTGTVGLHTQQVGTGLSIAGVCGVVASVLAGRLADRHGARVPLSIAYAATGVLFTLYGAVGSFTSFLVLASAISACEGAAEPLRATLTYALSRGERATVLRSQMRSVLNLGFVLGAALAAVALSVGTREAFWAVTLGNAASQLGCAVLTLRLRPGPGTAGAGNGTSPVPAPRARRAVSDLRFVALTLVHGGLELHQVVVTVAVPLWIIADTTAPKELNAGLLVLNTVMCIVWQVRIGRKAHDIPAAGRLQTRAGLILALSCCAAAVSGTTGPLAAAGALVLSAVVLVFGELYQTASAFTLSYDLPPPGSQGDYQGVFALRKGLRQTVGPVLLTWLVIGRGPVGWLVLGAGFAVLGLLGSRLVAGYTASPVPASADVPAEP